MAQKIYKGFMIKAMKEAWYQLSKEEQESLLAKVNAALEEVGGKRLVLCDSAWTSDAWVGFGVEEFPSIEAAQRHAHLLNELNWVRYIDGISLLGTEWQPL
jgi:hypothetical protein